MKQIYGKITQYGIVPVVAVDDLDHARPLAEALLAGGLPLIEVTFRTRIAAKVIDLLTRSYPELLVGAGTVLNLDALKTAQDMGAAFTVAPGINPELVTLAKDTEFLHIPGIATPTEIEMALSLGCKKLKMFPAEALGGVKLISALLAPYSHYEVSLMPTGGIKPQNLAAYLSFKEVLAVGGTWLARPQDMLANAWSEITKRCQHATQIAAQRSI